MQSVATSSQPGPLRAPKSKVIKSKKPTASPKVGHPKVEHDVHAQTADQKIPASPAMQKAQQIETETSMKQNSWTTKEVLSIVIQIVSISLVVIMAAVGVAVYVERSVSSIRIEGANNEATVSATLNTHDERFDRLDTTSDTINVALNTVNTTLAVHDERFDGIDTTLVAHDKRFDKIDTTLVAHDKRFDKIDAILIAHDKKFDRIEAILENHDKRFDRIEVTLENHGKRFDGIEATLNEINKKLN